MAKLTLTADEKVIAQAKKLAHERGTSVSAMFTQFVQALGAQRRMRNDLKGAPITRRSRGVAKVDPNKSYRELFEEAIQEKYNR